VTLGALTLLLLLWLPLGLVLFRQLRPSLAATAGSLVPAAATPPSGTAMVALGGTPGQPTPSPSMPARTPTAAPALPLVIEPGPPAPTAAPLGATAAAPALTPTSMALTPTPGVATASPTPPPPSPTAVPPSPAPTATPPSAAAVRQQVAAAEAALRTGQVDATIEYGTGTRSSATARFDFGDGGRPPRLHLTTVYQAATETQTVERIVIGEQWWQRQPDGSWGMIPPEEGVWGQIQAYLPQVRSVASIEPDTGPPTAPVLRWYDAGRNADVTLTIDPATGVPREMRQVARGSGTTLTAIYSHWNTPVEINPPPGS
jgi:hypothetical protein